MNRAALKTYAPQARKDFIQAISDRAAFYGITAEKTEPIKIRGDVVVILGREHSKAVASKRMLLEERIKQIGFAQTIEAIAYSWLNRFVALRYMELHGYLDHGYRVLSSPGSRQQAAGREDNSANPAPEVMLHAEHLDLPNLDKNTVIDLKLAGNKENELYRLILLAQCNALHQAMPFLFERIDDETELLLPENLLNSDSLIRKLVGEIEEEDWNEVEIIGWLYQFYISEKKDEVIGKVVASEDIPAATQLFTPNWIVKYLVQNTLGRLWLEHHPNSPLKAKMEYYIEPAEQTPEVQAQLQQVIEARTKANRGLTADCRLPSADFSLNLEELTLLDPACGSGHILVEAYDLFKAIYQERGYRAKDIPALILQKNLFGLEIDDRAAQLAAFALMMKARADDRRIFDSEAKPNILAFEDSQGMNANEIAYALNAPINKEDVPKEYLFEEIDEEKAGLFSKKALAEKGHVSQGDIAALLELFENAKTFGSLIQVPPKLATKLPEIEKRLNDVLTHGDLTHASAHVLKPLLQQARLLARQYDCVAANPPYMGARYCNPQLKAFLKDSYKGFDKDLFSAFVARDKQLTMPGGQLGFMMPFVWMFISSHETLRRLVLDEAAITSLIQLEYSGFAEATVPICTFTLKNAVLPDHSGSYVRLTTFRGAENQAPKTLEAIQNHNCGWFYTARQSDFRAIPGQPIAYWISERMRQCFRDGTPLGNITEPRQGMATTDNNQFLRLWHEVCHARIGFGCDDLEAARSSHMTWFPYNKGGSFRKWYGNNAFVVDYENDGQRLKDVVKEKYREKDYAQGFTDERWDKLIEVWVLKNQQFYFRPSITWSFISSSFFGVRQSDPGFIFDVAGSSAFVERDAIGLFAGFMCSSVAFMLMKALNPTMNFQVENVAALPVLQPQLVPRKAAIDAVVSDAVGLSRTDWDSFETSWDFQTLPVLRDQGSDAPRSAGRTLAQSQAAADAECLDRFQRMKQLEKENNRLFIDAYGLQDELSPAVPDDQITLYRPDRAQDIQRLISYALGCLMGRYSLDKGGLIYAHSGNEDFDPTQYKTFPADEDGIIPLLNTDWGIRDDAANRLVEFIGVAWPGPEGRWQQAEGSKDRKTADCLLPSANSLLEENLKFIAESLGASPDALPRDVIRKYLSSDFYKNHLQTYKRRPIYWLFSSGKLKAFQCLVYLHRYNEGTLSRMRTEYVIPLLGRLSARVEQLESDKLKASSTSQRKKLQKEQDDFKKQRSELMTFDEKLKNYADQKIKLDLDDGVKVNYAKFADILAEVKAVCGTKDDD